MYTLEICAVGLNNALIAQQHGAHRIELCENLESGGLTPSFGTLKMAAEKLNIPVHVLIRPRRGNYIYDRTEREIMLHDIELVRQLGFAGVVIGALKLDGTLDSETIEALKDAAGEMSVTFHRAIDVCTLPEAAIETLIRLGINRLLTSGGATKAMNGAAQIAKWQARYGAYINIMAGRGITSSNILDIMNITSIFEIHSSAKITLRSYEHTYHLKNEKSNEWWQFAVDDAEVKRMRLMLDELAFQPKLPFA
ncbi:MAG: copper homeostasis protein CutC [Bacteroidia bacterium]|jgi:copper homeostasis protein|nr:copper homeostasis protein CutC [Bacteroidia bacterium]